MKTKMKDLLSVRVLLGAMGLAACLGSIPVKGVVDVGGLFLGAILLCLWFELQREELADELKRVKPIL